MLRRPLFLGLFFALFVFFLDQGTKFWAESTLLFKVEVPVTPFFNLFLAHNTGVAFSFFRHMGEAERYALLAFTSLICLVIVWMLFQLKNTERGLCWALGLVLGGGLANGADRFFNGFVTDFLDFHVLGWHWPTFNLADSAICLGVVMILWSFRGSQEPG